MPWEHMGNWRCGLITRWRWMASFTPLMLYPQGRSPRYPLDRRLGGPQSQSGHREEEKNLTLSGIEPRPPAHSSLLYQLEQSCLTLINSAENNLMRRTKSKFRRVIKFCLQNVGEKMKKIIDACIDLTVHICVVWHPCTDGTRDVSPYSWSSRAEPSDNFLREMFYICTEYLIIVQASDFETLL
jgi:hypothetical protein